MDFELKPHPKIPKAEGPLLVCVLDGFGEHMVVPSVRVQVVRAARCGRLAMQGLCCSGTATPCSGICITCIGIVQR